jgi:hypothetical protein
MNKIFFFSNKSNTCHFLGVLIKKLKRLNRSTGNCSNSNGDTKSKEISFCS